MNCQARRNNFSFLRDKSCLLNDKRITHQPEKRPEEMFPLRITDMPDRNRLFSPTCMVEYYRTPTRANVARGHQ